jgi:hypothetical protein
MRKENITQKNKAISWKLESSKRQDEGSLPLVHSVPYSRLPRCATACLDENIPQGNPMWWKNATWGHAVDTGWLILSLCPGGLDD